MIVNFTKKNLLTLFLLLSFSSFSSAKMQYIPKTDLEIAKIIEYSKTYPNDISFILDILNKTANYKKIRVEGNAEDHISSLIKNIKKHDVIFSFSYFIYNDSTWKSKNTDENIKRILKNKDLILNYFGAESYIWSWFLMQIGSSKESIALLNKIFDLEYKRIMLLKRAYYKRSSHPLMHIQNIYKTLILVTKNKSKLKEKMRLIKTHISNLPQSHIKT